VIQPWNSGVTEVLLGGKGCEPLTPEIMASEFMEDGNKRLD
jgi:hypothetical protein